MCGAQLGHSTSRQLAATSELFQSEQSYFYCSLVGLWKHLLTGRPKENSLGGIHGQETVT